MKKKARIREEGQWRRYTYKTKLPSERKFRRINFQNKPLQGTKKKIYALKEGRKV